MNVTVRGRTRHYRTVTFDAARNTVRLIEQRLLPHQFRIISTHTYRETAGAIRNMIVRGAGAIGATAAYGLAQGTCQPPDDGDLAVWSGNLVGSVTFADLKPDQPRRKLIAHLTRHGCRLVREGKRHSWWENPANGHRTAVPRHTEVPDPLARKICRDLGVPDP